MTSIQDAQQNKTDFDNFIAENLGLVHSVCHKFTGEYEDLFQIGCIGLTKAVKTFKLNLGYTFPTYAFPIIRNEILMSLRKQHNYVYLDAPISTDEDGNDLTLLDMFADIGNVECSVLESIEAQEKLDILRSILNNKYTKVLDALSSDLKQHEIAVKTGLTRSYVNKLILKMKKAGRIIDKNYQTGSKTNLKRLGRKTL
jgi:RNA polymerase sporulation-specific sigma factor